jgi:hypothetical protein
MSRKGSNGLGWRAKRPLLRRVEEGTRRERSEAGEELQRLG